MTVSRSHVMVRIYSSSSALVLHEGSEWDSEVAIKHERTTHVTEIIKVLGIHQYDVLLVLTDETFIVCAIRYYSFNAYINL